MTSFDFLTPIVTQSDVVTFSDDRVNLKKEKAQQYRDQVNNLRDHLDRYLREHPDLGISKMQLSGSLAKGTALSTIKDVDVAVYVNGEAPSDLDALLNWLAERLRKTYPQMPYGAIRVDGPCVVISFSGTGIDVDISPILDLNDENGYGYLWDPITRKKIKTSIPLHLKFIRKRKEKHPNHYAQVIRLLKWWAKQRAKDTQNFELRSFILELIVTKLADDGLDFSNYHIALEKVFAYIIKSGLKERIAFTDNYTSSALPKSRVHPVEIFDPVSAENNVADNISEYTRQQIVDAAEKALDAISYARNCQTKRDSIQCWQELMGASFNA